MRVKFFAMGLMAVVAVIAMGLAPGSITARQNANANKRTPRPKSTAASKNSSSPAAASAATSEKPKARKTARKHSTGGVAIPSGGPGACVARLEELASKEPLTPYEKGPDQIINNGLLWNDPKSKCSVGADQTVRNKVFAVATAWQQKSADQVKTALADLKSSVPAAEMPMEHKKPRRHRAAASKSSSGAPSEAAPATSGSPKPASKSRSGKSKSSNKNSGA